MSTLTPHVGVLGLGLIGSRVAACLREKKFPLTVWNRTPHEFSALPPLCATPREVARSADVLQLFVADDAALRETMQSLLPVLEARHIVLSHATVSPDTVRILAPKVQATGAAFLDAPFTGSRDAAAKGQLVYYVSGDSRVLERARQVLSASAVAILSLGEIGTASAVKVATNIITAATTAALAEGVQLLRNQGINPQLLATALAHNAARSGVTDMKLPCMLVEDFAPHFSTRNMCKDLRIAADLAAPEQRAVIECLLTLLDEACQQGFADSDFSILAKTPPTISHSDSSCNAKLPPPTSAA